MFNKMSWHIQYNCHHIFAIIDKRHMNRVTMSVICQTEMKSWPKCVCTKCFFLLWNTRAMLIFQRRQHPRCLHEQIPCFDLHRIQDTDPQDLPIHLLAPAKISKGSKLSIRPGDSGLQYYMEVNLEDGQTALQAVLSHHLIQSYVGELIKSCSLRNTHCFARPRSSAQITYQHQVQCMKSYLHVLLLSFRYKAIQSVIGAALILVLKICRLWSNGCATSRACCILSLDRIHLWLPGICSFMPGTWSWISPCNQPQ